MSTYLGFLIVFIVSLPRLRFLIYGSQLLYLRKINLPCTVERPVFHFFNCTINNYRSSHPAVFCKNGALKFFKFHGKTPVLDLFFNKVAGLDLQLY